MARQILTETKASVNCETNWKHLTITPNHHDRQSRTSAWIRWSDEDNCYIAICPTFKHISTHGDTEQEAINELIIAMEGVLEIYQSEDWELPASI